MKRQLLLLLVGLMAVCTQAQQFQQEFGNPRKPFVQVVATPNHADGEALIPMGTMTDPGFLQILLCFLTKVELYHKRPWPFSPFSVSLPCAFDTYERITDRPPSN